MTKKKYNDKGSKKFVAVMTCVNLVLSIILALLNRREALRVAQSDDKIRAFLSAEREKHDL